MTLDRVIHTGAAFVLGVSMGGCVRSTTATYPDNWQPRTVATKAECPNLAGRHDNSGEMAAGTQCGGGRYRGRGEWRCDVSLSRNLADIDSGEWAELRQPDADTLLIVSSDPTVDVKEMRRSRGDFSCSAKGLERHLHASMMSIGDDSVVMDVSESQSGERSRNDRLLRKLGTPKMTPRIAR